MPTPTLSSPHPRRTWRAGTALATVLAAGVLTGCSGGTDAATAGGTSVDGSPSSSSAPPSSTAPSTQPSTPPSSSPAPAGTDSGTASTLQAALVDFGFELPSTDLEAGTYTIEVVNEGRASHDLVVEDSGGDDVAASEILAPGASGTVEVTLEPGEYVFYCSVGTHRAMGMELVVTVV